MPTTNFLPGTTITSDWLNEVDQVVHDSDGANYVNFTPAGTGAVSRTVQGKLREGVGVTPQDKGALGDNSNNDSTAVTDAFSNGTAVYVPDGIYRLTGGGPEITDPQNVLGSGRDAVLNVNTGASPVNEALRFTSVVSNTYTFGGALTQGQRTFTVNDSTGLSINDQVQMRLGTDPYDPNEEFLRFFNIVESVVGNDVTFRVGLPEAVADPGAATHEIVKFSKIIENFTVDGLTVDYVVGTTPDQMITLRSGRNVILRNLFAVKNSGAVVELIESENIIVENIYSQRADRTLHSTAGRVVAGWGMRNCVFRNIYAEDADGASIILESQCRGVTFDGVNINIGSGATAALSAIHIAGGCRDITIRNLRFYSAINVPVFSISQSSEVITENAYLYGGVKMFPVYSHYGVLWYNGVLYSRHKRYSRRIKIEKSWTNKVFLLPAGIYKRVCLYCNTKTGITAARLETTGAAGASILSILTAGAMIDPIASGNALIGGLIGTDYPFNNTDGKQFKFSTDGTVPDDAFLQVEIEYMSPASFASADDASRSLVFHGNQQQELHGSLTIADANTTGTISFTEPMTDTTYYVLVTPTAKGGAPAAASNRVESVSKAVGSFTVTLEAAPGAGTSRTFDWRVIR